MNLENRVLARMSSSDLERILRDVREVSLAKGHVLYEPHAQPDMVYFPSSAVASDVVVFQDGRSMETASVGREGVVGLLAALANTTAVTRGVSQVAGSLTSLPAGVLRQAAAESPP